MDGRKETRKFECETHLCRRRSPLFESIFRFESTFGRFWGTLSCATFRDAFSGLKPPSPLITKSTGGNSPFSSIRDACVTNWKGVAEDVLHLGNLVDDLPRHNGLVARLGDEVVRVVLECAHLESLEESEEAFRCRSRSSLRPFPVKRYCCIRLFGLSGIVRSIMPTLSSRPMVRFRWPSGTPLPSQTTRSRFVAENESSRQSIFNSTPEISDSTLDSAPDSAPDSAHLSLGKGLAVSAGNGKTTWKKFSV